MNEKARPKKLLDRVRDVLRVKHYAYRTEKAYVFWIRRFILFHEKKHPVDMGAKHIEEFLTHLAVDRNISASTQNQALNALIFLYRKVLKIDLTDPIDAVRAKRSSHLPVVLSKQEAIKVIGLISGEYQLIVKLLYGSGCLMECLRLRVKDIDFSMHQIVVCHGKGGKDRVTVLPDNVRAQLEMQLERVRAIHESDCERGFGYVNLPGALARKYPNASRQLAWQYVFLPDRCARIHGRAKFVVTTCTKPASERHLRKRSRRPGCESASNFDPSNSLRRSKNVL